MQCIEPPALSDDEIAAAAQGDGDERVLEHLRRCAGCAARFKEAKIFEDKLHSELYRLACPDSEQLSSFVAGILSEPDARAVRQHLETCRLCQADVELIRPMFQAQTERSKPKAPVNDFVQSIRASVAALITVLTVQSVPAVRSRNPLDAHKRQIVASDADDQILVTLELDRLDNGIRVRGQMILKAETEVGGSLVGLSGENSLIAAYINADGEFSINEIQPGQYTLRFTLPDTSQIILNAVDLSKPHD